MRADLGWSYLTAGAMNTVNAAGYLVGALLAPAWLRRFGARARASSPAPSATALALLGARRSSSATRALYALRFLTGVGSAATFVAGGLLAARLVGAAPAAPARGARQRASCSASTTAAPASASSPRR